MAGYCTPFIIINIEGIAKACTFNHCDPPHTDPKGPGSTAPKIVRFSLRPVSLDLEPAVVGAARRRTSGRQS